MMLEIDKSYLPSMPEKLAVSGLNALEIPKLLKYELRDYCTSNLNLGTYISSNVFYIF